MSSRELKLAAVYSEGKSLSVYDTANTEWLDIPGLLDFTESAGERDTRSTGTDSTRPHGVVSNMKAPTVEATFKYVQGAAWDLIDDALVEKTTLSWRFDTEGETVNDFADVTGLTVAIAQDGTCTFVNGSTLTADDFPLGACIKVGSTLYPLKDVTLTGSAVTTVKVEPITSAQSASAFTVVTPAERVSFRGKPASAPPRQHGVAQQSEREGTLTIQAMSILPKPDRIV